MSSPMHQAGDAAKSVAARPPKRRRLSSTRPNRRPKPSRSRPSNRPANSRGRPVPRPAMRSSPRRSGERGPVPSVRAVRDDGDEYP